MLDEIENVARAFYYTNDYARGWDREPEIIRNEFRARAKLIVETVNGFCQKPALGADSSARVALADPKGDLPGFLAILSGPKHVFHITNKAHRQLTGHRSLIDRPVREAVPELKDQGYLDILDEVYETGQPYKGSMKLVRIRTRRNGPLENRLLDFSYNPIVSESGQRLGILVEGRDVTGLIKP